MPRSALRELVEAKLGQDVCAWVRAQRKADASLGWRPLVEELERQTGRHVSHATLANWCRDCLDEG